MVDKITIPSGNVVRFPSEDRTRARTDGSKRIAENCDHGPSPEESLRIMRAFVAIKNRTVRASLTEMIEDASRPRGYGPTPAKD